MVVFYDGFKEITLLNPTIRTYIDVLIPHVGIPLHRPNGNYKYNLELGYDSNSDDYKVVMLVQLPFGSILNGEDIVREIYLFGLKLNMWRKIEDLPYYVS